MVTEALVPATIFILLMTAMSTGINLAMHCRHCSGPSPSWSQKWGQGGGYITGRSFAFTHHQGLRVLLLGNL